MADISKITPPGSQTTYNLKDAAAREQAAENKNNISTIAYQNPFSIYSLESKEMSGSGQVIPEGTLVDMVAGPYVLRFDSSIARNGTLVILNDSTEILRQSIDITVGTNIVRFTLSSAANNLRFAVSASATITNLSIISAVYYDSGRTGYQPYSLPNTKITPELIELVDSGAKNLFLPTARSRTNPTGFTGTITNNGDGSYTINGTAGSYAYYLELGTINLKAGTYVLYARPTQQSSFYIYNDGAWTDSDVSDNRYATFATDTTQNIYLRVDSNATVSNYTIYPMICTKAAWDVSQKYVPYRPTYEETVEQVAENENNISKVTPVTLSKRYAPQSADYEIISDLTISIPAHKKYLIHAMAMFNNVAPKGVVINKGNTIAANKNTVYAEITNDANDFGGLTTSAIMSNTGSTAFDACIFAKFKAASTSGSDIIVTYQDITESV